MKSARVFRFNQLLFLWIGIAALAYAGGSMAYAAARERYQSWKFERLMTVPQALNPPGVAVAIDLHDGDLIGKIEIPRIGISVMVLQGTEDRTLASGAGHVSGTSMPEGGGNVAIAAHRDTYFRNLKEIRPGDIIHFSTVHRNYEYVVDSMETADPDATRVLESRDRPELTLITCYPFYFVGSAPKRFVVHAQSNY